VVRTEARVLILLIASLSMVVPGCRKKNNAVVEYLENAEVQYEGEEQKENIIKALKDALHLPPEILQGKRYRDYQGNENSWDLVEVIYHHFVPDSNKKVLGPNFYYDITSPEGRKKVADILETLE
jgi:hypothetical protein